MSQQRQKILILYLANSALDSPVKGWTLYDGTGREAHTTGDGDRAPYPSGLDALLKDVITSQIKRTAGRKIGRRSLLSCYSNVR